MAILAQWSFNKIFWNESAGCLYDVVNGGPPDASVRPNHILAVSLHYSMLAADRAAKVVETVQRELLTPVGLRTLPTSDPRYIGKYLEINARATPPITRAQCGRGCLGRSLKVI